MYSERKLAKDFWLLPRSLTEVIWAIVYPSETLRPCHSLTLETAPALALLWLWGRISQETDFSPCINLVGSHTAAAPSPEAVKDLCPLTCCRKKAINSDQGKLSATDPKGTGATDWKWPRQKWMSWLVQLLLRDFTWKYKSFHFQYILSSASQSNLSQFPFPLCPAVRNLTTVLLEKVPIPGSREMHYFKEKKKDPPSVNSLITGLQTYCLCPSWSLPQVHILFWFFSLFLLLTLWFPAFLPTGSPSPPVFLHLVCFMHGCSLESLPDLFSPHMLSQGLLFYFLDFSHHLYFQIGPLPYIANLDVQMPAQYLY